MSRFKRRTSVEVEGLELRVIGGRLRGSKLRYHGDPVTRPMKDRVREAIFNLVNTDASDRHVIDLFAGTGALAIEAISRGAVSATLIEKHVPTARIVEDNLAAVGLQSQAALLTTSAFLWGRRDLARVRLGAQPADQAQSMVREDAAPPLDRPWLVFCSPPYAFYRERWGEMEQLLGEVIRTMPADSMLVVEADESFDFGLVVELALVEAPESHSSWRIRSYPPAVVGIWRKP